RARGLPHLKPVSYVIAVNGVNAHFQRETRGCCPTRTHWTAAFAVWDWFPRIKNGPAPSGAEPRILRYFSLSPRCGGPGIVPILPGTGCGSYAGAPGPP